MVEKRNDPEGAEDIGCFQKGEKTTEN